MQKNINESMPSTMLTTMYGIAIIALAPTGAQSDADPELNASGPSLTDQAAVPRPRPQ